MKKDYFKLSLIILIFIFIFNFDVIAQWQKISTPWGGYIQCFIEKDKTIYAGTSDNGLFYSTDKGIKWNKFTNSPGLNIKSLTVNAEWIFTITEKGFFKSNDNGISWQSINAGSKNYDVKAQNGVIYLADDNGIYTSENNGVTWTINDYTRIPYNFSYSGNSLIAITWGANVFILNEQTKTWTSKYLPYYVYTSTAAVYNNKIYVGTWGNGLYVSSNNGDSWQKISSSLFANGNISQIAVVGNIIYLCSDGLGVFSSGDEGLTWTKVSTGLDNLNFTTMHGYDNKIFVGTNTGIYTSINNGLNWSSSSDGIEANTILSFAENNGKYFLGTNHGLFASSDNGNTWQVQASEIIYDPIKSILVDGNNVLIGTTNGLIYSANNGVDWTKRGLNTGGYQIYDITKYKNYYIIATNGGVYMSSNLGASWTRKTSAYPDIHFTLMVKNDTIYSGGLSGALYSGDSGNTWQSWTSLNSRTNSEINILKSFKNTLLANTNFDSFNLFVSYNNGVDWDKKEIYPLSLTTDDNKLYVGTNNGLLVSTDGTSFFKIDTLTTERISVLRNYNNYIYACVNSFDLWKTQVSTGINNFNMTKLLIYPNPADKEIVIKNDELSVYKIRIIDMNGKVINNQFQYHKSKFNVSNIANGIYVIEITDDIGRKSSGKLNIQHLN